MRTVSASSGQSISHGRQNQQVRLASKARPQAMQRAASFWASSGVRTCSVTAVRLLSAAGSRVRLPRGTPLERSRWGSKSLHQPAPTDIQVLRQGSLAPADDDTTPVVYVSVRDQSRHVFGLRAEVERLLRAEKYDITDNPSQAGFIIQASVLEAGITDAASAHRMVEGGYGAPSELSGKGATLVLSDILLVQRRVPSDKRPKRFMLQNVGSRNARGSSQMRTGLLAHREFSVDSGIPALFVTLLAREITSPFSTAPQEQAPAQPQDERRP